MITIFTNNLKIATNPPADIIAGKCLTLHPNFNKHSHTLYMLRKLLLSAAIVAAVSATATTPLTLDQCVAIALSENPTVQVADMEITRTDYSRTETLAQLFPQINFGANYSRMLAKQIMYMNMDAFGSGMPGAGGATDSETDSDDPSPRKSSGGNTTGI